MNPLFLKDHSLSMKSGRLKKLMMIISLVKMDLKIHRHGPLKIKILDLEINLFEISFS